MNENILIEHVLFSFLEIYFIFLCTWAYLKNLKSRIETFLKWSPILVRRKKIVIIIDAHIRKFRKFSVWALLMKLLKFAPLWKRIWPEYLLEIAKTIFIGFFNSLSDTLAHLVKINPKTEI